MQPVDFGADHGEQRSQELWLELAARLAEGCCRNGLSGHQGDARATRLFPERVEHEAVAATAGIGCHEQQKGHQQLGGERASSREICGLAATVCPPRGFEQLPYESHQRFVERRKYGNAVFGQPLACQLADVSWVSRRKASRRLPSPHPITFAKGLHAQSRASSTAVRHEERAALVDDEVNGIGLGATGGRRTKRSGLAAKASARTMSRAARIWLPRPWWTSEGVSSARLEW